MDTSDKIRMNVKREGIKDCNENEK